MDTFGSSSGKMMEVPLVRKKLSITSSSMAIPFGCSSSQKQTLMLRLKSVETKAQQYTTKTTKHLLY